MGDSDLSLEGLSHFVRQAVALAFHKVPTVVHNYNRLAQVWLDDYKEKSISQLCPFLLCARRVRPGRRSFSCAVPVALSRSVSLRFYIVKPDARSMKLGA